MKIKCLKKNGPHDPLPKKIIRNVDEPLKIKPPLNETPTEKKK
jgi:hypothetical protein